MNENEPIICADCDYYKGQECSCWGYEVAPDNTCPEWTPMMPLIEPPEHTCIMSEQTAAKLGEAMFKPTPEVILSDAIHEAASIIGTYTTGAKFGADVNWYDMKKAAKSVSAVILAAVREKVESIRNNNPYKPEIIQYSAWDLACKAILKELK